jgi:hypothetical protein
MARTRGVSLIIIDMTWLTYHFTMAAVCTSRQICCNWIGFHSIDNKAIDLGLDLVPRNYILRIPCILIRTIIVYPSLSRIILS